MSQSNLKLTILNFFLIALFTNCEKDSNAIDKISIYLEELEKTKITTCPNLKKTVVINNSKDREIKVLINFKTFETNNLTRIANQEQTSFILLPKEKKYWSWSIKGACLGDQKVSISDKDGNQIPLTTGFEAVNNYYDIEIVSAFYTN